MGTELVKVMLCCCWLTVTVWEGPMVPLAPFSVSTAKVYEPLVVGVPESTPVLSSRLNPGGSVPDAWRNVAAGSPGGVDDW